MDFATIQSKISNNQYSSVDEVIADIRLIFSNCSVYYSMPTSPQRLAGIKLSRHFERRLKELKLTTATTSSAASKSSRTGANRPVSRASKWLKCWFPAPFWHLTLKLWAESLSSDHCHFYYLTDYCYVHVSISAEHVGGCTIVWRFDSLKVTYPKVR